MTQEQYKYYTAGYDDGKQSVGDQYVQIILKKDQEIERLKAENSKMRQALEWTKLEPGQPLPEKRIRVQAWDGLIIWEAFIDFDGKWKWMFADERGEAHQETNTITHWRPIGPDPVATEALKTNGTKS